VAFTCAASIYEHDATPSMPGFSFEKEGYIGPSITGTTKATGIYVVRNSDNVSPNTNEFLPMVVVSIRGTASRVDRLVNLNGDSKALHLSVSI
jgi:hypothetical protein